MQLYMVPHFQYESYLYQKNLSNIFSLIPVNNCELFFNTRIRGHTDRRKEMYRYIESEYNSKSIGLKKQWI